LSTGERHGVCDGLFDAGVAAVASVSSVAAATTALLVSRSCKSRGISKRAAVAAAATAVVAAATEGLGGGVCEGGAVAAAATAELRITGSQARVARAPSPSSNSRRASGHAAREGLGGVPEGLRSLARGAQFTCFTGYWYKSSLRAAQSACFTGTKSMRNIELNQH
jgi:hypothetical protein